MSAVADLSDPILNGPFDAPSRYFEIGPAGPTGEVREGRRPSESFIPIPASRKAKSAGGIQEALDFDVMGERRERNMFVNDLRREVDRWRLRDFERVTPTTRKLLQYWADPHRENRVLYCQREAAETAIFLTEVAGRHGYADWRRQIADHNAEHNKGLPRLALKMATGSGKTVVMAMLIAWQAANKVASPRDARFAKRFLVVTPGITIKDRLRVLRPVDAVNYYDLRDLVPPDLKAAVAQAQIVITNYHAFQLKDVKEIRGVASVTRKILQAGRTEDAFVETPDAMVSRVLRDFSAGSDQIVVFNDEAHHCYRDRPLESVGTSTLTKEDLETARVWFTGLQAVMRKVGVKVMFDLSATPFYLSGSGYPEGFIFPWVVSDFSLMDAIESGIVKIPRIPVDDDAAGEQVTYLRLWDHVGKQLPKARSSKSVAVTDWLPPKELEGALHSLYRNYSRAFARWEQEMRQLGEPPPVFIVVCSNTAVSKLVHDYIAGSGSADGALPLLANVVDGVDRHRPRTILVDSVQLESGESLNPEFRTAAAAEIEAFQEEYRRRNPGIDAEALTDEDLLREVMNTVGKIGRLGEQIRCVVSVSMLTEGWDVNTVTHILGIRAFGSQLLCEQVVGRGLRRRSYAVNDRGFFDAEYANVYGIPFAFIPSDRVIPEKLPGRPPVMVESLPEREHLRIEFPNLHGYRFEIPDDHIDFEPASAPRFAFGPSTVPTWTAVEGLVGASEQHTSIVAAARLQEVTYTLAGRIIRDHLNVGDDRRPWLFPSVCRITRTWLTECVDLTDGYPLGMLLTATELQAEAAEAIYSAIVSYPGSRRPRLRPILRRFGSVGSTGAVSFATRKAVETTEKSEISHVTLDGIDGNTWEQLMALTLELDPRVAAYAKNDHVGFEIPYVHQGRTHSYLPDFLVRLIQRDSDVPRTLIIEVSGGQKSPGPTKAKAETARKYWCPAINNHHGFGRWGYVEVTTMDDIKGQVSAAVDNLYADRNIGDAEFLDFAETERVSHAAS